MTAAIVAFFQSHSFSPSTVRSLSLGKYRIGGSTPSLEMIRSLEMKTVPGGAVRSRISSVAAAGASLSKRWFMFASLAYLSRRVDQRSLLR
jgi:hypothetical protein